MNITSLRFEKLSFAYPEQKPSLNQVSFELPMDQVINVRSADGEGKSTLLKLLIGLIEPTSGEYWINDQAMTQMTFEELKPYRLKMGFSFDMGGLLSNRSLLENLILPLAYHNICSRSEAKERAHKLLHRFDLGSAENERPSAVSGSKRKLVCLLRALVHRPEVLILDEPTVGLSQEKLSRFLEVVKEGLSEKWLRHVFIVCGDERVLQSDFFNGEILIQDEKLQFLNKVRRAA